MTDLLDLYKLRVREAFRELVDEGRLTLDEANEHLEGLDTEPLGGADSPDRPLQHNPDPLAVVDVGVCTGCHKRAPWCSCGKADYR